VFAVAVRLANDRRTRLFNIINDKTMHIDLTDESYERDNFKSADQEAFRAVVRRKLK